MALDFPNSPTLNQQYDAPNGVTYTWDGRAWRAFGQSGGSAAWTNILGKPEAFPPEAHIHQVADVIGLDDALDAKAPVAHTHPVADLRVPAGINVGALLRVKADGTIELVVPTQDTSILSFGADPPADPAVQPLWFDTTGLVLMVSFDDGTSRQWVPAVPGGGGGTPPGEPGPGTPENALTLRDGTALTGRDGTTLETR